MISTHAPTRGATNEWDYFFPNVYISTHAPTRGATAGQSGVAKSGNYFNPRSHEGSDDDVFNLSNSSVVFQPTLPRGERHNLLNITMSFIYFNPRSHEGSDCNRPAASRVLSDISTHAPTRGATPLQIMTLNSSRISTHAPTRGATYLPNFRQQLLTYFNPRSHEGSDLQVIPERSLFQISTHAPTRGATLC